MSDRQTKKMSTSGEFITVECIASVPIEQAWKLWTDPEHVVHWNFASPDWHTPRATTDLTVGGKYCARMEAKDGSAGFDCEGIFDKICEHELLESHFADARKIEVKFSRTENGTKISQTFETETVHPAELQRAGWQNIMDNFRKYAESL